MENEKTRTWWDEINQIANLKLIGEYDDVHANQAVQKYRDFLDIMDERNILLQRVMYDISEAGDATSEAKRIFASFARSIVGNYKDLKIAYVGGSKLATMASRFIHKLTKIGEVGYFKNKEEAIKWLKN